MSTSTQSYPMPPTASETSGGAPITLLDNQGNPLQMTAGDAWTKLAGFDPKGSVKVKYPDGSVQDENVKDLRGFLTQYALPRPDQPKVPSDVVKPVSRLQGAFGTGDVKAPVGGTFGSQDWKNKIPGDAVNAGVSLGSNLLLPGSGPISSIISGAVAGGLGGAAGNATDQLINKRKLDVRESVKAGGKQAIGQGLLSAVLGRATPENTVPETIIARGGTIPGVLGPQAASPAGNLATRSSTPGNPALDLAAHVPSSMTGGVPVGFMAQIARMLGRAKAPVGEIPPMPEITGGRTGSPVKPMSSPIGSLPLNPPAPAPRVALPGTNNPSAAIQSAASQGTIPGPGGPLPGQFPPLQPPVMPGTNGPLATMPTVPAGPLSTSIPTGTTLQDMSPLSMAQRAQMAKLLKGSGTGVPGPRNFEPAQTSAQEAKNALSDLMSKAKNPAKPVVKPSPEPPDPIKYDEVKLWEALQNVMRGNKPVGGGGTR